MHYHKLDITAVSLSDEFGFVALAADPLWLEILDGALQVSARPRRVPQAEEPGPGDGAGEAHPPARHHQHRLGLVSHHEPPDAGHTLEMS